MIVARDWRTEIDRSIRSLTGKVTVVICQYGQKTQPNDNLSISSRLQQRMHWVFNRNKTPKKSPSQNNLTPISTAALLFAKIQKDKVAGTIKISSDDGSRDLPWEATRTVELSDVVGTWNLELESPNGELHEPTLKIAKKDNQYSGIYAAGEIGDFSGKDLKAKGVTLTFVFSGELGENTFEAKCTAHPKGNKLEGKIDVKINDETFELPLTGKRALVDKKV